MVTLADSITNCQSQLDELNVNNKFWSPKEIRVWINDGVRDVARRAEVLLVYNSSMTANPGQAKYGLPNDVIRVHRVEYVPGNSTQIYPVIGSTYDELDQIWGINPTTQSSYPTAYACWGTPGNVTIQFYPVPSQSGHFNIFYYRMPQNMDTDGSDDAQSLQIPSGWDDLIVQYVSMRGLMKARDPAWQIYKAEYTENIEYLTEVTRQAHDNGRYVQTMTSSVPGWLYAFTDM
jgi:hypothetical protein